MKKLALIILDGFGINDVTKHENAIYLSDGKCFERLFSCLHTRLGASGKDVGLPTGQIGNSEVGHLSIGAGRLIRQTLVKIDDMFDQGIFSEIDSFKRLISHVESNSSNLHIFTLFGPGGVHASHDHLIRILSTLPSEIQIKLHLFGDGRDLPPKSMLEYLELFQSTIDKMPNVRIATICGRYYAMDRDNNYDRIFKSYDQIVNMNLLTEFTPIQYVKDSYEKGIFDEFLEPIGFDIDGFVKDGDGVIFLNFRSDRAKQLTKAFVDKDFDGFQRKSFDDLMFVTMTNYYPQYSGEVFVQDDPLENILAKLLSDKGFTQLHIAETEKFAHVTKFFNGGNQVIFPGEIDILVDTHKVPTYDLDPEMAAQEIYQKYVENVLNFDFCVVNFANPDMVGHTGNMDAVIKSIRKLDEIIGKIISFNKENDIELLITADHGNCEEMGIPDNPKTSHTTNPVPFWYLSGGEIVKTLPIGKLCDIAPTVLNIMGIEIPKEMDGNSLIG